MATTEKPKARKVVDSPRQKLLQKKILENAGKKPMGKLMEEVGYKPGYAKNPQQLRKTQSWSDQLNRYIPNKLAFKIHKKLIKSVEFIEKKTSNGKTKIVEQPTAGAAKGLDMLYKMRGYYVPEEQKHSFSERVEESLERLSKILPDPTS